ncbi:MAG: CvpA family protein [Calditrichaeota bacterium]|nr:MAG: CvpA family protein [Calditrichota bacterium]
MQNCVRSGCLVLADIDWRHLSVMGYVMDVNFLDIGFIALILAFAIWGWRQKLLMQIVGFIGLFIGIFLSMESLEIVAPIFASISLVSGSTAILISLITVFLIVVYFYHFFYRWAHKRAKMKIPAFLENGGGLLFGVLSSVLIACMLSISMALLPLGGTLQAQMDGAKVRSHIESAGIGIYDFITKKINGSLTFIQCLEAATKEVGVGEFDDNYIGLLLELNSSEAIKWKSTATK